MTFHTDSILVIDFGSQSTQLIARRIRELGVYCEVVPFYSSQDKFEKLKPVGVIFSGGPESVLNENSPRAPQCVLDSGVPIFAICYGQQTLCYQLNGFIESGTSCEFGRSNVEIIKNSPLFEDFWSVGSSYPVWMNHRDRITQLPDGFEVVGRSPNAPYAIAVNEDRQYYSTIFHPEVVHTPDGTRLLSNFLYKIIGLKGAWSLSSYRNQMIQEIREKVGSSRVICGLSGGVDSSVAAILINEAIGNQLICILVDHGFMRVNEPLDVTQMFRQYYNIPLMRIDASDRFINELKDESDPEIKRKKIGKLFINIFEEEARKIGGVEFLAQGTLYPDVIESISVSDSPSVTIKSHHNVGGLPEYIDIKLIEPLRGLFKDEVRALGRELGLPDHFIKRHPFPGPGLAIRCLGSITRERLEILQKADAIYLDEIKSFGLYDEIWQACAILLPIQTVGVMGDSRTYESVCVLRAVVSIDGMTADFYCHDMSFLGNVATRIINEVRGINRVVYDITSKPPGTIEWE
ncbi:glutamine-hydrolyzing GMP synthase [Candidatus Endowatersipora endosymbiont of Watersipora subatra]|uniref:glutamine-hydrolyzing GMP synthase n=1 Tax=Candidatus Endowatersipora endosymbiont of Watersipora subatra TaxID=3077946 RepID=UPI00312C87F6